MQKPEIDIEKFVLFHRTRVSLSKRLLKEKIHGKLIYQVAFLGIESLSKLLYPKMTSGKRFIKLLSQVVSKDEATGLYKFWRNPLTHAGFITNPWTALEAWGDEDIQFMYFPDTNSMRSSQEYPPGSIIAIYNDLITYIERYFKETNTKRIRISDS